MISEQYIKRSFVQKVLSDELNAIKDLQAAAFSSLGLHERSGALLSSLHNIATASLSGSSVKIVQKYVAHMRFLDMSKKEKKRKGFPLYNKIIYGRIYGHAIAVLRHGFSESIQEALKQELQDAMNINAEINL